MLMRTSLLLLSGAIGLSLVGCSATSPTLRGQSPCGEGSSWNTAGRGHSHGPGHECPMCDSGFSGAGMPMDAYECEVGGHGGRRMTRRAQRNACQHCSGVGCDQCINLPCHPVHRNFHTYSVPRGLSYPEQDAAAAMVQYPYYTFRGPTDFFMQ
ncbi:MAG: hypothetical protein R3C49_07095 [Planctomycetaceae bacterium]